MPAERVAPRRRVKPVDYMVGKAIALDRTRKRGQCAFLPPATYAIGDIRLLPGQLLLDGSVSTAFGDRRGSLAYGQSGVRLTHVRFVHGLGDAQSRCWVITIPTADSRGRTRSCVATIRSTMYWQRRIENYRLLTRPRVHTDGMWFAGLHLRGVVGL
jgi:hypothetical protein